jgi:exopolysaccharide biosynthesis polyprenyl glycosylphosphotransferase
LRVKESLIAHRTVAQEGARSESIVADMAERPHQLRSREVAATVRLPWWRDALRRRMLALADVGTSVIAILVATSSASGAGWALLTIPVWILLAKLFGLYDRDHRALRHLTIDEFPSLAGWAASGVIAVVLTLHIAGVDSPPDWRVLLAWGTAVLSATVLRAVARWAWRRVTPPEATIIVGHGPLSTSIRRKLELFPDMHLSLVGHLQPPRGQGSSRELDGLAESADRLVVASERIDPEMIERLAASCRKQQSKLSVVSPLRGRSGPLARLSQVADLPVIELDTWDVSRSTVMLKRAFDITVSAGLLTLFVPLFPLIAVLIRLDSRGPVFFTQRRAGLGGKPFRMYKFRTMASDAEERLGEVVSLDDLNEPMFKIRRDPRVTRFGRVLRRLSLDEVPQLFNVLKGDMSLVGPRPEELQVVERYGPEHRFRLEVKPGLTGPMQVCGRGELTFAERLAVEHDYIEHMSLTRDLRILLLTIPTSLRGTGAF